MISIGHWKDFDDLLQGKWRLLHGSEQKSDMIVNHLGCFYSVTLPTEYWGCACEFFILSSLEGFVIWWATRQTSCHARLSVIIAAP